MSRPLAGSEALGQRARRWVQLPGERERAAVVVIGLVAGGAVLRAGVTGVPAALVVVGGAGLAAVSPLAAVVAVIAALPFAYRTVEVAGGRFSLLEVAIMVALVGTAVATSASLRQPVGRQRVRRATRPPWLWIAAAGIVAAGSVSLLVTAGSEQAAESLRVFRWTILEPVAFWGVCRLTLQGEAERLVAALALAGVGALVGVAAVVESFVGSGGVTSGEIVRAQLSYPHPNNLAFFLERAAMLAAGLAVVGRNRRLAAGLAILALAGTAATFSRGALLAVIGGLAWLIATRGERRRIATAALAVPAVGMALAIWLGGRLFDAGGGGAEPTRLPIWRSSVRMVLDHPWRGVGLDGFLYEYWRRYVEPAGWPERYTSHPHNLVLDVWLRLGILGLLAFASLAVAVVVAARSDRRGGSGSGSLWVAATAALVAGLLHGLVDNGYFLPDLAVMTWLLIALSVSHAAGATPDSS